LADRRKPRHGVLGPRPLRGWWQCQRRLV
jgi:hypothetical protein